MSAPGVEGDDLRIVEGMFAGTEWIEVSLAAIVYVVSVVGEEV